MSKAVITIIGGFGFNCELLSFIRKLGITLHMVDINLFPATDTLEDMINNMADQLDSSKHNVVVGYSTGGLIALGIAKCYPTFLKQAVLLNSTPKFMQSGNWNGIKETDFNQLNTSLAEQSLIKFLSYFATLAAHPKKVKRLEYQNYLSNPTKKSLFNLLNIIQTTDLRLELLDLEVNILFINSSADILVPQNSLPIQCKQILLPNSSHTEFDQELVLKTLTEVLCKHNML